MSLSQAVRDTAAAAKQRAEDFDNIPWVKVKLAGGEDFEWKLTANSRNKRPQLSVRSVHPITINRVNYTVHVSLYFHGNHYSGFPWVADYQNSWTRRVDDDGAWNYSKPVTDVARVKLDELVRVVVVAAVQHPEFSARNEVAVQVIKHSSITEAYSELLRAEEKVARKVLHYSSL